MEPLFYFKKINSEIMKKGSLLFVVLLFVQLSNAQIFKDFGTKLEERAKRKVEQKVDEKIDRHMDKTLDNADKKSDKKIEDVKNGNHENQTSKSSKKNKEIKSTKDFVSGTKILAEENFSQDALGDFPVNMLSNAGGEVVEFEGSKWLSLGGNGAFTIKNFNKELPDNFTFEFELSCSDNFGWKSKELGVVFASSKNGKKDYLKWGENKHDQNGLKIGIHPRDFSNSNIGTTRFFIYEGNNEIMKNEKTQTHFTNSKNPVKLQFWRQKTRLRVYIDGIKIWDVQEAFNNSKYNVISFVLGDYEGEQRFYITNLKLAEAGADTRHKLIETGTYTTNEILFETNKALIKKSSETVLNEIGLALQSNSEFKVMIIGHTDSDGNDSENLKLSEKRAESVKKYLIDKFGIESSRMQVAGKGETVPIADNSSEEGKRLNRRVEFKKI